MTIDPELLMAYADGELGPIEAKRVERAIAEDPALGAQVARHRALRDQLSAHFAAVPLEPVPERLTGVLRSNVVALPVRPAPRRLPGWTRWGGAIAASLVLGLALGQGLQSPGAVQTRGGRLYAAGPLARALDRQLASNTGPVRVIVTFRDAKGAYCRVFAAQPADGIACRDDRGWALRQTRAGGGSAKTDYAQAGSADPALMAAAQEMMAGAPLDADAEAKARSAGWK